MDDISISRKTALMGAGLAIAMIVMAYAVFSAPAPAANAASPAAVFADSGSQGGPVATAGAPAGAGAQGAGVQDIYIKALGSGAYDRQEVTVNKGVPVRLHFSAEPNAGCGRAFYIYGLDVRAISKSGEEDVVDFIPPEAGTYEYNCGMRMWRPGRLVVV